MSLRWFRIHLKKKCLTLIIIFIILITITVTIFQKHINFGDRNTISEDKLTTTTTTSSSLFFNQKLIPDQNGVLPIEKYNQHELRMQIMKDRIGRLSKRIQPQPIIVHTNNSVAKLNYNVHTFYYAWYKSKAFDGEWAHWNHKYLENWNKNDKKVYPTGSHVPPLDIGANYYPLLGCYSSNDPDIIYQHLKQLKSAGIGVLVISWTPPGKTDSPDNIMQILLDTAEIFKIKISLHIEPYKDRNPINFKDAWKDFLSIYGSHNALYRLRKNKIGPLLPVVYIYDSYLIPAPSWKEIFSPDGKITVRNTELDAIFIGLLVDAQHKAHIKRSHFDGFYTYFATNGFSFGSTWKNWRSLSKFALQAKLIFIPSVGPGYTDTKVRPWNAASTRARGNGRYYEIAWHTAINSGAEFVSITSFNEWHEGTQIEPAISESGYMDYEPYGAYHYLNLTKELIAQGPKNN